MFKAASLAIVVALIASQEVGPSLFDGQSLRGWVVEHPSGSPASASDGVLRIADKAGWVRTERTKFGTFVLKFEARATRPKTRAVVAMFGVPPEGRTAGSAYAVTLFGSDHPDARKFSRMLLVVLPQAPAMAAVALGPVGEWQAYQVARRESRIVVVANGIVVIDQEGPRTLDGWLGFLTQGGDTEIRNIQVSPVAEEPPSGIYRPGGDVTLPRVLREQKPKYTRSAMAAGIQGTVLLECVVGPDGRVNRAVVARSLDQVNGLDEEARLAALEWRFEPGLRMGKPVSVLVTIELSFTLKN